LADSNIGKPVMIDGNVVGELFAVFCDGDTLVEQLRKRMAAIGISYGVVEELAEMSEGGLRKYLSPARVHQLTLPSMLRITEAIGLKALLVVDPKLVAKVSPSWSKRDERRVRARRPALGQAQLRRILTGRGRARAPRPRRVHALDDGRKAERDRPARRGGTLGAQTRRVVGTA
jgi:hypothetical protein